MSQPPSPSGKRQEHVQEIGRRLLTQARADRHWWRRLAQEDAILERLMGHQRLRTAALRFVDVLPGLRSDAEFTRHLQEYFGDQDLDLPWPALAHWGLHQARSGIAGHLVAPVVRAMVKRLARRFIAGAEPQIAAAALHRLHRKGMGFTLDLLGEAVVSETEAQAYQQRYLQLMEDLQPLTAQWPRHALLETVSGRTSPRLNLSLKVSALYPRLDPADPERAVDIIKGRLRPILQRARLLGASITLDMEQYEAREITLRVFQEILVEPAFADWPDAGLALQAYLRQTPRDLEDLLVWARRRACPVTIRLVRGAYWDYETVIAAQNGWPCPVWRHKGETDACYEACLERLLENHPHVEAAVATHNVRSLALAMTLAQELGIGPHQYEIQMLYGMADELKARLVQDGQRVRVYVPVGQLIPGMAYLVRRLLENTASQSFLRMGFSEGLSPELLLAKPQATEEPPPTAASPSLSAGAPEPFRNEPLRRFTDPKEREAFAASIEQVRTRLGRPYPLIIGEMEEATETQLLSLNPADPRQVVGASAKAEAAQAHRAVEAAHQAFPEWRKTPARQRAQVLQRAADIMRSRRDELAAWEIFEAGKPWREADADVTEAIDFLEYYAQEALRLAHSRSFQAPGETNDYLYEPRGPGVVIAPWNFPLAIPTGMAAAAIAAGNTVVLKPAPQTPVIAYHLADILRDAGLPPGVLNHLPGGDEAGEALVRDPRVHFIAFTGSESVGCHICQAAAGVGPGQDHLKHVVVEMGGKNAMIIDSDADLDEAVVSVAASAFGYAGQKCSACSRAIVVGDLYEPFLRRLVEAAASLAIGPPQSPTTFVGPVINSEARDRILRAIETGEASALQSAPVLDGRLASHGAGYFIGPTIFADVAPESPLAQEEIFGPVLAVLRAQDFSHALNLANATRYALTGGVWSRSPAHLAQARSEFRVGNLYLNRKITGALVGRQPFGGMKLSGTNAKAGGPDYLLNFLQARCITENTIRRGFAPEESE